MDIINPYLRMRTDAEKTQKTVALYSDTSKQTVHRLEHGLFNSAPFEAARDLLDSLPNDYSNTILAELLRAKSAGHVDWNEVLEITRGSTAKLTTDQTLKLVQLWYTVWQRQKRAHVAALIKANGYENPPVACTPEMFRKWFMSFVVDANEDDAMSLNNFCRTISLHPYTWQRWEASYQPGRKHLPIPPTVQTLLTDLGVDKVQWT